MSEINKNYLSQNEFDVSGLRLSIVPVGLVSAGDAEVETDFNLAYDYFKKTWSKILSHIVDDSAYKAESLFCCHYLLTIFDRENVVAQLATRFVNLNFNIHADTVYMKDFDGPARDYLEAHKCKRVMSLEWNSVNPRYSRRRTGLPFVEVSMLLATRLAQMFSADACIGLPRRMTGVNEVTKTIGFHAIGEPKIKYNCPIDTVVGLINNFTAHSEPEVETIINKLWSERVFLMNCFNQEKPKQMENKYELRDASAF